MDNSGSAPLPVMHPDWRVFAYLGILVLIATVVSSLAPVRAAFELDLLTALKGREGSATRRSRTTGILVIAQLAMSFVLLTAAVIFARLPQMVTDIDPGFVTRQIMTVPLDVDTSASNRTAALAFYRQLEARIRTMPGAQSLAYESIEPFRQASPSEVRLANQAKGQGRPVSINDVSADFFSTFSIPLVYGRSFQHSDVSDTASAPVAVVSEAFVKTVWGGSNPIGKVVIAPDDRRLMVVGIARDTRSEHYGVVDGPRLYTLRSPQALGGNLFVRFSGDASAVSSSIGQIVRALDKTQVDAPETLWDSLESSAVQMRSLARIILFMAGVAMALAITGVYAVLSFAIGQRTREFGIQMVLGATQQRIFRSVMVSGLRQIAVGLACGVALATPASWELARLLKRSPLPLKPFDASVCAISALVLTVVALAAMCLPALRATQVDPIQSIRDQ